MAISAGTVLLVATGGVLVYAGFTSQNPLTALKEVASGKPSSVRNAPSVNSASFVSTGVTGSYADVVPGEGVTSLPRAVERFAGDRYSQTRRWDNGYSDCSSFVGKGLKALGIKPPGVSTTWSYLGSSEWRRIPESDVRAGDLAISANHVVICYGDGNGIGQQNPRSNVQKGKVSDLMIGNKPFVYLRYVAGTAVKPKTVMV